MDPRISSVPVTIRATLTSYIVLCGIWVILAAGYFLLSYRTPGESLETGAVIAGGVGLAWGIWLRGFRITVSERILEYRNGFYRSSSLPMNQIVKIKNDWIEWGLFGRRIRIPRMAVIARDHAKSILINPKPSASYELKQVREILEHGINVVEGEPS
jgi:hypothetical protein